MVNGGIITLMAISIIVGSLLQGASNSNHPLEAQPLNEMTFKTPMVALTPHDPIVIDGNTEMEAYFAGNGTDGLSWETAFHITNLIITGSGSGIHIQNTDKYIVISNSTIEDFQGDWGSSDETRWDKGINIQNSKNIKILNCTLRNNGYGIYLNVSTNVFITNNNCSANHHGITIYNSTNNTIFNNTASINTYYGIYLKGSTANNISDNVANKNQHGIHLDELYNGSDYLTPEDNILHNNLLQNNTVFGISMTDSDNNNASNNTVIGTGNIGLYFYRADGNSIENNTFSYTQGRGVSVHYSRDNIFSANNISHNDAYGIYLYSSYSNQFLNCKIYANDGPGFGIWHNSESNLIETNIISHNTYGIHIYNSRSNTIRGNNITDHTGYGIVVEYTSFEYENQDISDNYFDSNLDDIVFQYIPDVTTDPVNEYPYSYYVEAFIGIVFLCLIILLIVFRKKIQMWVRKFSAKRAVKRRERKLKKAESQEIINDYKLARKNWKQAEKRYQQANEKHPIRKIAVRVGQVVLVVTFIIITYGLGLLLVIPVLFRTKFRLWRRNFSAERALNKSQRSVKQAEAHEKLHNYKLSRKHWISARKSYQTALRKHPDYIKQSYIERNIFVIKQKIVSTILSEGIFLSTIGWKLYLKNDISKATKIYKQAIKKIKQAISNIESRNREDSDFSYPIQISFLIEIINFYKKVLLQFDLKEESNKAAKNQSTFISLQDLNEKIAEAIKKTNESLWIFDQTLKSTENLFELGEITTLINDKLSDSNEILSNIQERVKYLTGYAQSSISQTRSQEISSITTETNSAPNLKIIREYEYIGGKIRFKVGITNQSGSVITNLALRFDLPDSLKWIIHEPNLKRRGDTIHFAKLGGHEKISVSLYLQPMNCLDSQINATLTYFDSQDHPQAIIMASKQVSITCPIFFTRDEANPARVQKIRLQLKYTDRKIFPLADGQQSELVFNKILESIGKHDIQLVHKEFSLDEKKGQALYYGLTKVKREQMIIQLLLDSTHNIIEIVVYGDNQESITGLLAELESQIRDRLLLHNIIRDSNQFHDINTSVLLGNCPYCNGPISGEGISLFTKGEKIMCKYCDTTIVPY
jgi:parallel beta-helix repeat protein